MIHLVYGTRAELIKFSPLIRGLKKKKISFKLIDTGDHDTRSLRQELKLPEPNYYFGKSPREMWIYNQARASIPARSASLLAGSPDNPPLYSAALRR